MFRKKLDAIMAYKSQEQIADLVEGVKEGGPLEYIREINFKMYSVNNYKDLLLTSHHKRTQEPASFFYTGVILETAMLRRYERKGGKRILFCGDDDIDQAAIYLASVIHAEGYDLQYLPSELAFLPEIDVESHDLVIFSDYPVPGSPGNRCTASATMFWTAAIS
ncbi:MAG: hypothetical protein U5N26_06095 [Candidatus Marinimicrobia bacterium]|nr:hypothetical protein [Candidatus Neomarinimicrobiota bacterium]